MYQGYIDKSHALKSLPSLLVTFLSHPRIWYTKCMLIILKHLLVLLKQQHCGQRWFKNLLISWCCRILSFRTKKWKIGGGGGASPPNPLDLLGLGDWVEHFQDIPNEGLTRPSPSNSLSREVWIGWGWADPFW